MIDLIDDATANKTYRSTQVRLMFEGDYQGDSVGRQWELLIELLSRRKNRSQKITIFR